MTEGHNPTPEEDRPEGRSFRVSGDEPRTCCEGCGKELEPEDEHWEHAEDCPGYPCACDLIYCRDCCPTCRRGAR